MRNYEVSWCFRLWLVNDCLMMSCENYSHQVRWMVVETVSSYAMVIGYRLSQTNMSGVIGSSKNVENTLINKLWIINTTVWF